MTERPILFSAPMVRAILECRKTQTRRVVKLNAAGRAQYSGLQWHVEDPQVWRASPYGVPGDRLWVRETFCGHWGPALVSWSHKYTGDAAIRQTTGLAAHASEENPLWLYYRADDERKPPHLKWSPSIHMPRWASRITLEVSGVRVERVKSLSREDAISEGAVSRPMCSGFQQRDDGWSLDWSRVGQRSKHTRSGSGVLAESDISMATPYGAYANYWVEINGADSWAANPWVWVVEFKRVEERHDG